jgi:hypothetical protein
MSERHLDSGGFVDATTLAAHLGVTRTYVY